MLADLLWTNPSCEAKSLTAASISVSVEKVISGVCKCDGGEPARGKKEHGKKEHGDGEPEGGNGELKSRGGDSNNGSFHCVNPVYELNQ